ncbi:MAG: hypothetical protein V3S30_04855 [Thermoanaerobaculia bacterium]
MARRQIAFLALCWMMATTLHAGDVQEAGVLASFEEINSALKGHKATVEINGYDPVLGARDVVLGPVQTTWRVGTQKQQIATTAVQRITIKKSSRSNKWMKWGAVIGAGAGAIGGGYSEADGVFLASPDASQIAKSAITGAAVGAAGGVLAGDKVVYEAGSDESVVADL